MSLACGIDFGTSNSSVGFMAGGEPTLVPLEGASVTIPSAIFYPAYNGSLSFGRAAIGLYIDRENGRLFRAIKSILGGSLIHETTAAGGRRVAFTAILGRFLHHLKDKTELCAGRSVESAVLGRPVFFVDDNETADRVAQDQLAAAAHAQGFKNVLFQYEPIAAALDYERRIEREEIALIADIGGGTSDFSIVKVSPRNRRKIERKDDILANAGVHVGGTDLDYRLSLKQVMPLFGYQTRQRKRPELDLPNGYFHDLAQWHRIAFLYNNKTLEELKQLRAIADEPEKVDRFVRAIDDRAGHRVAGDVESAKIILSDAATAMIDLAYIDETLRIETSRRLFEETIANECRKLSDCVAHCLKTAGVAAGDVDTVFFTGGSTSIPAIERACLAHTPRAKIVRGDKFASVGVGLTIDSGLKFGPGV
ncbi:MAG TPA: Hsp70 family protein [Methylosinus sp.]|uniref:Hsp70 family protein n=1 Tax=Methylosinus sp. TaxID=427 RepID=UPI002F95DE1A